MSGGIPSWARVGAKVVCIEGGDPECAAHTMFGLDWPKTSEVVTVVRAFINPWNVPVLHLKEYPSPDERYGWDIARFRPLITQSDDISAHFAHLLDTSAPELV